MADELAVLAHHVIEKERIRAAAESTGGELVMLDDDDDPIRFFRGLPWGFVLSLSLWALIYLVLRLCHVL